MPVMRKDGIALLFVHVPKTGGTSIEDAFRTAGWSVDLLDRKAAAGSANHFRRCSPQHLHAADLERTVRLDRIEASFAFVREPRARLLSEYVWRHRKQGEISTDAASFEQWLKEAFARFRLDPYADDNHLRPQTEFMLPGTRVFRFEDSLESGMRDLREATGLDIPVEVPRSQDASNTTGIRGADIEVTESASSAIFKQYTTDYERFGYASAPVGIREARRGWFGRR